MATRLPAGGGGGYGTISPATNAGQSGFDGDTFFTRARRTTESAMATLRPWREVVNLASFSRPDSYAAAADRIRWNLSYFRVNYVMAALGILFLGLLWHPVSMIVFLAVFVAWFFLYFFRDGPVAVAGREIDDRVVLVALGIVTVVALVLTDVGVNVLVSLVVGACLVGVHAALRENEDLFLDEDGGSSSSGRMVSVVGGQPLRSTYAPI